MTDIDDKQRAYNQAVFGRDCPDMAIGTLGLLRSVIARYPDECREDTILFAKMTADLPDETSVTITKTGIGLTQIQ